MLLVLPVFPRQFFHLGSFRARGNQSSTHYLECVSVCGLGSAVLWAKVNVWQGCVKFLTSLATSQASRSTYACMCSLDRWTDDWADG